MTSELDEVLQDVDAVAHAVATIVGAKLTSDERDEVCGKLAAYVQSLQRIGGTQIECMIVIGALRAMGYDFSKLK